MCTIVKYLHMLRRAFLLLMLKCKKTVVWKLEGLSLKRPFSHIGLIYLISK